MKYYSFKDNLELNIYGASHAECVGVKIKGLPRGFKINEKRLKEFLKRRAPSDKNGSTSRREPDEYIFVEGVREGVIAGDFVTAEIPNVNVVSKDYSELKYIPRPGHADMAAYMKYGIDCDMSGGGAFSGRMTAPLCIAGGIMAQLLAEKGIAISAHLYSVGGAFDKAFDPVNPLEIKNVNGLPLIDENSAEKILQEINNARAKGDSVGGIVECAVTGVPAGLGGPLFEGLESMISFLAFAIPGVKGVEFGSGFAAAAALGSQNNDTYEYKNGSLIIPTNRCGGILGGISLGNPIIFRTAFKPTPSILVVQRTVNVFTKENTEISVSGRHDACIALRAVPVVEAAAAIAVYDKLLGEENGVE